MKKKTIVFIVIGLILVLTFSLFAVLLVKFRRGADPNNEDAVLAEAKAAEERDDPPAAAGAYGRLTKAWRSFLRTAIWNLRAYSRKHRETVRVTSRAVP